MAMMRDFIDDNVRARLESVTDVSDVYLGGGAENKFRFCSIRQRWPSES